MTKTAKTILWVVIIVIVIGAIWYGLTRKPAEEVIKIGVITPLSSDMVNWGESMKGGIEIAVDERNSIINGKPIQLIFEDNKACDSKETVTAMRKLIDIDKVKVTLVGCSGATMSAAPIAEENQVILLTPMASAGQISQAGDFVFRTSISDTAMGKFLGKYLIEKLNFKKIAVLYANNDYGVGFFNNLKPSFENSGGEILQAEEYIFGATDFRTNLTKIKAKSPEALVVISYGQEGGLIAKQIKELDIDVQIIGGDNFGTQEVVEAGGEAVEGAIFTTPALDETKPEVIELKEKFQNKYGKEPPVLISVADGYDAANLLLDAIEEKGYNPFGIKDYLYSIKDYPGISGVITIDENGDAVKPVSIQTIKNGQFVPYEE